MAGFPKKDKQIFETFQKNHEILWLDFPKKLDFSPEKWYHVIVASSILQERKQQA